jgi:4-hydroxythreonine-4-phosphate dehydrogenase
MKIGVTLGDPRGIGPEVAAAAAASLRATDADAECIFIGPADSPARTAAAGFIAAGGSAYADTPAAAGRTAALAIETAVRLATERVIDALVTAPLDKGALAAAGYAFPGHTEMLAALTGTTEVAMLMAAERTALGGPLRVTLATTHLALAAVPAALDAATLISQTRLTADALHSLWRLPRPRIALCAFNPHASDGGLFGDEEARIFEPALAELRRLDFDVTGPVPADSVFRRALHGEFDAVVAPYHDVGMAAFKTVAFGHGVNVTLGLPFIRTSPDHGTAFDIAGRGRADPASMLEAMRLAIRLAAQHPTPAAA